MGWGGLVFLFDTLTQLTEVPFKIKQFEKMIKKGNIMQEGCREETVVTELVTLRGKVRPSERFSQRTVIHVDHAKTEISYLVELHKKYQ